MNLRLHIIVQPSPFTHIKHCHTTQVGTRLDALPTSYERYLVNGIRRELGFDAVPVRVNLKSPKNPYNANRGGGGNYSGGGGER